MPPITCASLYFRYPGILLACTGLVFGLFLNAPACATDLVSVISTVSQEVTVSSTFTSENTKSLYACFRTIGDNQCGQQGGTVQCSTAGGVFIDYQNTPMAALPFTTPVASGADMHCSVTLYPPIQDDQQFVISNGNGLTVIITLQKVVTSTCAATVKNFVSFALRTNGTMTTTIPVQFTSGTGSLVLTSDYLTAGGLELRDENSVAGITLRPGDGWTEGTDHWVTDTDNPSVEVTAGDQQGKYSASATLTLSCK